ncbi:unnamed protein product [Aphanomyces euteiches]
MAARAAFSSFCSTWSEHKDELLQLPPPEMRDIFVQCYGGHGISTANGPASADMAKDAMVEEEMVEDDVVGVDEILDYPVECTPPCAWSVVASRPKLPQSKRVVVVRVDVLCEDERYEDQLRPADHSSKDNSRMWMATSLA